MPLTITAENVLDAEGNPVLDAQGNPITQDVEVHDVRAVDPPLAIGSDRVAGGLSVSEIDVLEDLSVAWRVQLQGGVVVSVPKLSADPVADTRAEFGS